MQAAGCNIQAPRVSRGGESFSEEEAGAANWDETTGVGGKGCEGRREREGRGRGRQQHHKSFLKQKASLG